MNGVQKAEETEGVENKESLLHPSFLCLAWKMGVCHEEMSFEREYIGQVLSCLRYLSREVYFIPVYLRAMCRTAEVGKDTALYRYSAVMEFMHCILGTTST